MLRSGLFVLFTRRAVFAPAGATGLGGNIRPLLGCQRFETGESVFERRWYGFNVGLRVPRGVVGWGGFVVVFGRDGCHVSAVFFYVTVKVNVRRDICVTSFGP